MKKENNKQRNMKKYYFTFGCGQQHEKHYVVIEAKSWDNNRRQ